MRPGCHVIAAALLVGVVASADDAKTLDDFFAKCYQLESLRDGDGLTRELKKAPTVVRASYRYPYYQTVAFYLNHQSEEAHKHSDLTLRALKERNAKESTIATVQKALEEWAAWDYARIRAESWESEFGGYIHFTLSEEEEAKSKDLLRPPVKKSRRDFTPWERGVQDTYWGTTPETSQALLKAMYKDLLLVPPEPQAPQPIELPADEGASTSPPQQSVH